MFTDEQIDALAAQWGKTREEVLAKAEEVRLQVIKDLAVAGDCSDEEIAAFRKTWTARVMGRGLKEMHPQEEPHMKPETVNRVLAAIRRINAERERAGRVPPAVNHPGVPEEWRRA